MRNCHFWPQLGLPYFLLSKSRWLALLVLTCCNFSLLAEGSKDFIDYPGHRLFFDTKNPQQIKVFAKAGEFINVGASHIGLSEGFIEVYAPDGTLVATYNDDSNGEAVIYNNVQEINGPTGGGTTSGTGYQPGIVPVTAANEGVWTVVFDFPMYNPGNFDNLLNNEAWTRANNQPNIPRAILAWDVTVSTGNAGNEGGTLLEGRVYSKEYISIINLNGTTTSPKFYILARDGFIYQVDFMETDPYRFPLTSNNLGFTDGDLNPIFKSVEKDDLNRSDDPSNWSPDELYFYEPQAEDYNNGEIINNKIFFNPPDPTMPNMAQVTDIYRNNTHVTWLYSEPNELTVDIENLELIAFNSDETKKCLPNTIEEGMGAYLKFEVSLSGTAELMLDLNNDGDYNDPEDRMIIKSVNAGIDSIFWDGKYGTGEVVREGLDIVINFSLQIRGGEIHIIMSDIENNEGGVSFQLYNDIDVDNTDLFYYDHTSIGGGMSGSSSDGAIMPTNIPFTYSSNFGNNKFLDYWAFVNYEGGNASTLIINIADDCAGIDVADSDGDGIPDNIDIDDDNDGVPDRKEFCNPAAGFDCLPGMVDPSMDEDGDGIPNYIDSADPAVPHGCPDADANGICDVIAAEYDTDGDNVPDHLDLDSDNDGITDLVEAGHRQADANGDGMIDGLPTDFGQNGLFNFIATDNDDPAAVETYNRWDWDVDGIPDHDDLDADNDGINDVHEAGYPMDDLNNDGRIDNPNVDTYGLASRISFIMNNTPIPLPIDFDGDNLPDWHDLDSDNDSIHDVEEAGMTDDENDGVIGIPTFTTINDDGQAVDDNSNIPLTTTRPKDTDNDLVPDFHDLDTDNDGIHDVIEAEQNDPDNDGRVGTGMPITNNFGVPVFDVFGNPSMGTSRPRDTDFDLVRDYRDLDTDNDGLNDVVEGNNPDDDEDGFIGFGFPSVDDNGVAFASAIGETLTPSSFPPDSNDDDEFDFRSLDSDSDGISDVVEGGNVDPDFDDIIGTGFPIVNGFGQALKDGNLLDIMPISSPTDTDGDDIPDFQELDSDDDGIHDQDECPDDAPCKDGDDDGMPDFQDFDRDNDGIPDFYECETSTPCPDTDEDGILDVDDLDTDGDGLLDALECPNGAPCPDSNGNGIPDWREFQCSPMVPVPEPVNISGAGVYCMGEDLILSAENEVDIEGEVEFIWSGPNGFIGWGFAPATGPFTATLSDLSTLNAGTYTLELITKDGCPGQSQAITVTVNEMPETPELTLAESQICQGGMAQLSATVFSGETTHYQWYFDDGTGPVLFETTTVPTLFLPDLNMDQTGFYFVMSEVAGCTSLVSNIEYLEVSDDLEETPTLQINSEAVCEGAMIELNSSIIQGANVQYNWYFDNGDGSGPSLISVTPVPTLFIGNANDNDSGIYYVQAQIGGCSSSFSNAESLEIDNYMTDTPALAATESTICEGEMIELNSTIIQGGNVQYNWYFDNGNGINLINTTAVPTLFINNAGMDEAGVYYVEAQIGNCLSMLSNAEIIAISNLTDQTPMISVVDDVLCEGELLELNAENMSGTDNEYEWFFNDGTGNQSIATTDIPTLFLENISAQNSGNYSVIVSQNNCRSNPSNAQNIKVVPKPELMASNSSSLENPACLGEAVELSIPMIMGATYEWIGPMGFTADIPNPIVESVDMNAVGEYMAVITTESCTFMSDPTDVYVYNEIQAVDDEFLLEFNQSLESTDLVENDALGNVEDWLVTIVEAPDFGTVEEAGGMVIYTPRTNYFGEDRFVYQVCNMNCPDICDEAMVRVQVSGSNQTDECFIPNIITPNNDGANDMFKIPCLDDTYTDNRVQIFNRWGDEVFQAAPYLNNWDADYKGRPLPPGTYFYLVYPEADQEECMTGYFTITR